MTLSTRSVDLGVSSGATAGECGDGVTVEGVSGRVSLCDRGGVRRWVLAGERA